MDTMLDSDFKKLIENVKKEVLSTRFKIMACANSELINLYFKLGGMLHENAKYGNKFIDNVSRALKLEFPNVKGFSARNLARMKTFYEEYKDLSILPMTSAKLPWSHNYLLIEKIKDKEIRFWYAEQCYKNGWSFVVLDHQIDLKLYERQKLANKLNNFNDSLDVVQSELARDILKDPYIFELENIKDKAHELEIENAMLEKIKNVLLELGKGFSFVGSQYKISTENLDYYIDMLFYHLELRCYVVVELKNSEFKPEFIGQLGFCVTAINETLKKENDNNTIGLLLCKGKDKLSVEWSLKGSNNPIGVSTYEINNYLPTESDINKYLDMSDIKFK